MGAYSLRLDEVRAYFNNRDFHLGYRRLLDAAIETKSFDVYRETLLFCDAYDVLNPEKDAAIVQEKVAALLPLLDRAAPPESAAGAAFAIRASSIGKRYAKGAFSLSPLDLELSAGTVLGIVGENGNGKTTLLRLLYGELQPDSGSIRYGFAKAGDDFFTIKTDLAFIPQRPQSWYGGLMENLQYASSYAGYKGEENKLWTEMIIARMGLRPYRSYDWSRISSGYKMRFELARTLLRRPLVLLLDEPLANLDILAQQIILEDLKFLAASEGMPLAVVLSSQQLYEVEKVSDQVLFLQKGTGSYRQEAHAEQQLVLELDAAVGHEELRQLLQPAGLQKQSFNGGVHILYFAPGTTASTVLIRIGEAAISVRYLRDISHSSRRFFIA